jgi:hypothetical protein
MAEITILDLINNLIDKAYDTGWTAGAIEQGRNDLRDIQQAGISKRGVAKEWLLREVAELESLRAENAALLEQVAMGDAIGFAVLGWIEHGGGPKRFTALKALVETWKAAWLCRQGLEG